MVTCADSVNPIRSKASKGGYSARIMPERGLPVPSREGRPLETCSNAGPRKMTVHDRTRLTGCSCYNKHISLPLQGKVARRAG